MSKSACFCCAPERGKQVAVLLSVIVPVYGTRAYLSTCLESLRTQSLRDVEFILVDDASPDGAQQVMQAYAQKDSRFRIVTHAENRGLFASRLTGAKAAQGEFLAFLDSDDYVSVDFYRAAVALAQEKQLDLVMGDTIWRRENGECVVYPAHADQVLQEEMHGTDIRDAFFSQAMSCYSWHTIWNKVIRRTLWDTCAPYYDQMTGHVIMTEDIAFSVVLFFFAKHFFRHHGDGVFYCEHATSSTGDAGQARKFRKNYADIVKVFAFAEHFLQGQGEAAQQALADLQRARRSYARMWHALCQQNRRTAQDAQDIDRLTEQLCPGFSAEDTPDKQDVRDVFWFEQASVPWRDGTERIKRAILGLDGVKCPVVSFDVFDTLLLRPFRQPQDLFQTLEESWQRANRRCLTSFTQARTEAEAAARRWIPKEQQDVTLWNIYSAMQHLLGVSDECIGQMTYNEREVEVRFCQPRRTGLQLLRLAQAAGRRVVLISDMYLDKATIERMLQKCGVTGYERFFLSNEEHALKWNGSLYRVALRHLQVQPEQVLHIGDQAQVDVQAARKAGLHAMQLPRSVDVWQDASCTQMPSLGQSCLAGFATPAGVQPLALRCAQALAANRFFDDGYAPVTADSAFAGYPSRMGYYAVGTHLLALAHWLLRKCRQDGVKRLVFLARDGLMLKQAVELLRQPEDALETDYIPASRRCLLPALITNQADLAALPVSWQHYTPEKLMQLLSFCTDKRADAQAMVQAAGYAWTEPFADKVQFDEFLRFFRERLYDGCAHQAAYSMAREYYEEKLPEGSACFDMGYSGRLQAALCQLTQRSIPVYYVHDNGDEATRLGAAYDFPITSFYPVAPAMSGAFREFLLSAEEAPCVGFLRKDGHVVPRYEEQTVHAPRHFLTQCIQHHALQFVRDFRDTFADTCVMQHLPELALALPFEGVLRELPEGDLMMLDGVPFEDTVYAGQAALDLRTLVRDQSGQALGAAKQLGAQSAPSRMVGFIPEQTPLVKRTIGFLLFDRKLFRQKLRKRLGRGKA